MGGLMGGWLALLGRLGHLIHRLLRCALWLLIGKTAWNWSMDTLEVGSPNFNSQRFGREVTGCVAADFALFIIFNAADHGGTGFLFGLAQSVLFAVAQLSRSALE